MSRFVLSFAYKPNAIPAKFVCVHFIAIQSTLLAFMICFIDMRRAETDMYELYWAAIEAFNIQIYVD